MNDLALLPENAERLYEKKLISHKTYRDTYLKREYKKLREKGKSKDDIADELSEIIWEKNGQKYLLGRETVLKIIGCKVK